MCSRIYIESFAKYHFNLRCHLLSSSGSLQVRYKLNRHQLPDAFNFDFQNLADGRLHQLKMNWEGGHGLCRGNVGTPSLRISNPMQQFGNQF
jgi:hypothetical protein